MTRYCGRSFGERELAFIRRLIEEDSAVTRAKLSRLVCERLDWRKPDGGLKDMSCRVALLRMERDGLLSLPPPTRTISRRPPLRTSRADPRIPVNLPARSLETLRLDLVRNERERRLWNEYVHRYHYLGYTPLAGGQLRYFIRADFGDLALLSFSAAAWRTAPRDDFIGWTGERRQRNLHLVVNNSRFLILPWITSKNLASKILSLAAKRLPDHWLERYGYRPVLMESFVQRDRFSGTCYRAANWTLVGQTKGRGKLGPAGKQSVPVKDIWLYPLHRSFRRILCREET